MWGGAADGLLGAVVAGVFSLLLWWVDRRRSSGALQSAWQTQAEKLRDELRGVYEKQIQYLEGQSAAKDSEIERKAGEIRRLNKLLNRRGAGDD